jgi:hypothetical protein
LASASNIQFTHDAVALPPDSVAIMIANQSAME